MVTTRRSGKSSDKEELTTRKSTRTHDEKKLRKGDLVGTDMRPDMLGSGGGEDNDSGDDMPEQVTFATGKQVRMLT